MGNQNKGKSCDWRRVCRPGTRRGPRGVVEFPFARTVICTCPVFHCAFSHSHTRTHTRAHHGDIYVSSVILTLRRWTRGLVHYLTLGHSRGIGICRYHTRDRTGLVLGPFACTHCMWTLCLPRDSVVCFVSPSVQFVDQKVPVSPL